MSHCVVCVCGLTVPCVAYNPGRSRLVLPREGPQVERLLHNAAVFHQREAHCGGAAAMHTALQSEGNNGE